MDQQALFELYTFLVIGVVAQSVLAWELGSKGIQRLIAAGRPNGRILVAFALFAAGGVWSRIAGLESPYQSWADAWPVVVAIIVYVIGRSRRSDERSNP